MSLPLKEYLRNAALWAVSLPTRGRRYVSSVCLYSLVPLLSLVLSILAREPLASSSPAPNRQKQLLYLTLNSMQNPLELKFQRLIPANLQTWKIVLSEGFFFSHNLLCRPEHPSATRRKTAQTPWILAQPD